MNNTKADISPQLGKGIYSIPDAATILDLPKNKVRRWIKKYWEMEFVKENGEYTWGEGRERAFNFYTLIELITVHTLREYGVTFPVIKEAHDRLSTLLETPYPFANSELLSDGDRIFYEHDTSLLQLDKKQQFSFTRLVAPYCKKIDFHDKTLMAERFWPLGKNHDIVVDPHHHFGQPVLVGTNITVYTIINLLRAGESPEFIAELYELDLKQVEDARRYMKRLAA